MAKSSIDVIETVLGERLFPRTWKARSIAELDPADPACQVPAISERQYHEIQARLVDHWHAARPTSEDDPACVLINLRHVSRVHRFARLAVLSSQDEMVVDQMAFRAMVAPQIRMDDGVVVRRALLYSETVAVNDPAQLLRPPSTGNRLPSGEQTPRPAFESAGEWQTGWRSAVQQLGLLHKLVRAGIVTLMPMADLSFDLPHDDRPDGLAERERAQLADLEEFFRSELCLPLLASLPFGSWQEAGIYTAWALGQFAWRNIVMPGAAPWLPDSRCLAALAGLEQPLRQTMMGPAELTLGRLSSRVGIDVAKVSDEDIIALRRNEALFAAWRQIVAELSLEAEQLGVARAGDMRTLIGSKQQLWQNELDRHTGAGGVLAGLLDVNAIICGLITGGATLASGATAEVSGVAALGGGLVTPLLRLVRNAYESFGSGTRRRALAAHFLALEG